MLNNTYYETINVNLIKLNIILIPILDSIEYVNYYRQHKLSIILWFSNNDSLKVITEDIFALFSSLWQEYPKYKKTVLKYNYIMNAIYNLYMISQRNLSS